MKTYQFINELEQLNTEPVKRGELAILRKGLQVSDGNNPVMYQVIYPILHKAGNKNKEEKKFYESKYYLPLVCQLATLYSVHPSAPNKYGRDHNLGDHMRIAAGDRKEATSRRFNILLTVDEEDLFSHLKHAVRFIASAKNSVFINYHALFDALLYWGSDDKNIQKDWARAYYREPLTSKSDSEDLETETTTERK